VIDNVQTLSVIILILLKEKLAIFVNTKNHKIINKRKFYIQNSKIKKLNLGFIKMEIELVNNVKT